MLHEEWSATEEILRRLHDPDEEMEAALDHLRKNFFGPFCALRAYREDPSRLEAWWEAEKPSQPWRQGFYLDQALRLLATDLYG